MAGNRMDRRRFIGIAGGASAAMAALLTGCAQSAAPAAPAAPAGGASGQSSGRTIGAPANQPEVKDIVIAMDNPNYATQAQYYIAREFGFFKEEGFNDVQILTADETFKGVVGGSITFSNTDTDELINGVLEGVDAIMVGCNRDHEWQLYGFGADIKAPADLKGKKVIMQTPGTREYARARKAISAWSNGEIDIERDCEAITVSGGSDNWNQALVSGQVSASIQYPRHVKSVKEAGGSILLGGWNEVPQEAIVTRKSFAEANPNTVTNYLRAIIKARAVWKDASRRDEIIAMLKGTGQFNFREGFEVAYFVEPEQYSLHAGFAMQAMNSFLTDLSSYGIIPETLKYQDFTNLTFLHAAQKDVLNTNIPPTEDQSLLTLY